MPLICPVICGISIREIRFTLQVEIQSKFSSTSFKEPTKIPKSKMDSTPGSLLEVVKSVMIYILISTTTLFVLHAIKTAYYIISSPIFGSQRNFFLGNSFTYLQFFHQECVFFSSAFLCSSSNFFFFCHFQVAQFFL